MLLGALWDIGVEESRHLEEVQDRGLLTCFAPQLVGTSLAPRCSRCNLNPAIHFVGIWLGLSPDDSQLQGMEVLRR